MKWFVRTVLPPLVPLVVVILLLELLSSKEIISSYFFPPPSRVYETLKTEWSRDLARATWQTTVGALAGFGLSAACGLILAILLASSRWIQQAFYPYAIFFQTVPIIAIAPLLVIWFGFGLPTVVASAFIVSVFPVIANTLSGLLSTDPALRDLFRLYGASGFDSLVKLKLPSALPNIMTGLRIAAGLAVIGAIVGEFIAGGGLGGAVDAARTQQKVEKVFAAVLLASLLGLALFGAVNLLSRLTLRNWHASEQQR